MSRCLSLRGVRGSSLLSSLGCAGPFAVHQRRFAGGSSGKLFDKILIANRGEIAVRVMQTCQKLGIKTVAVYSEADRQSMHVKMADEAVCIGPAASQQSYLNIPALIDAVKRTKAQAVHPGYGFLSEKVDFCEALEKENVAFIGPKPHALRSMGDKISAKTLAQQAKVNTVPGFIGTIATAEEAVKIAQGIGYPVMIKASQGGGGKGMRIAWNDDEVRLGFRLSLQEAKSAFNSDAIFVEKFIEEPRHIEIQVLADSFGNAVYVNERECSIQRRNQKVIEEAPSPFLDAKTRAMMGEQAVALAKAVQYQSAGTCEFLVDKHRNFYFLEMNTRLQVEHPITEQITGIDLVEQMIRIAAGHKLPFTQKDIPLKGWAFESRVYAEDPLRGFLPSIGTLKRYIEPTGKGVRCDSGIEEGNQISIYYDPMICKLITTGKDRADALQKMRDALDSYVIRGVTHNINFLRSLCDHPRFIAGDINTNFIPDEYPDGYKGHVLTPQDKETLISGATIVFAQTLLTKLNISRDGARTPNFTDAETKRWVDEISDLVVVFGGETFNVKAEPRDESTLSLRINGKKVLVSSNYTRGDLVFDVTVGGERARLQHIASSEAVAQYNIQLLGTEYQLEVHPRRQYELLKHMPKKVEIDTSKLIQSPMPGAVVSIAVEVGDSVVPGQEVCIVEAMKMQNVLRSQTAGKVKAISVKPGQSVARDEVLIEFE